MRRDRAIDRDERASPLPTGVVTFLMSDIEGSTSLWDTHHDAMAKALERHDAIVAQVISTHGGRLLRTKGEGDSTFSVFTRASHAAAAALEIEAQLRCEPWPDAVVIRVRIALHTGEAHERDGDYFGPTPNRAARVRSLASGGQIYVTEATASSIRDYLPDAASLVEVGEHDLKGLSRSEHVFELKRGASGEVPATTWAQPPLPRDLRSEGFFVGRDDVFERIRTSWESASRGGLRAILIGGEPGIGKTRLSSQIAAHAHADGDVVLFGRCDESFGSAYQPFVEALSECAQSTPDFVRELGAHAAVLGRFIPAIAANAGRPPEFSDPETERLAFFEAVTTAVRNLAERKTVVLVLDDIHWATSPTLSLLRHLVRLTEVRVLIVATYRDTELGRGHPLAAVLADLRRASNVERIKLSGLDTGGVERFLEASAGHALDERGQELAAALRDESEGNPFFIGEIVANLVETGAIYQKDGMWTSDVAVSEMGLPEGVREVIGRRLARLSEAANEVLRVGSVCGATFDLGTVERIVKDVDVVTELEDALAGGLVREAGAATYTFAHALIRQTLYQELSATRRMRLHRSVGEALEATGTADSAALAFHFAEAAVDGQAQKAADYAIEAATKVIGVAPDQGLELVRRGIEALDAGDADWARRCDLEAIAARCIGSVTSGVDYQERRKWFLRAAESARRAGDVERLAFVAAYFASSQTLGIPDPDAEALVAEALRETGEDERYKASRADLLAEWSRYLFAQRNDIEGAARVAEDALLIAHELDDPDVLLAALRARNAALSTSPDLDRRLAALDEELAVEAMSSGRLMQLSRAGRLDLHLERGDIAAAEEELRLLERNVQWGWIGSTEYSVIRKMMRGELAEAEEITQRRLARVEGRAVIDFAFGHLLWIGIERGQEEELQPLLDDAAEQYPGITALRVTRTMTRAVTGNPEQASAELTEMLANDFQGLHRGTQWPLSLAIAARTAYTLEDKAAAKSIYEALKGRAGQLILMPFTTCAGPADTYLGSLQTVLGDFDAAAGHFETALALAKQVESPPFVARTKLLYAQMLERRRGPHDVDRMRDLADDAYRIATGCGMVRVATESKQLLR